MIERKAEAELRKVEAENEKLRFETLELERRNRSFRPITLFPEYSTGGQIVYRIDAAAPLAHLREQLPLPTGADALEGPFAAFPSWFLCIECDRCGKVQMVNRVHSAERTWPFASSSIECAMMAAAEGQGKPSC